jgi:hypothetical protein
MHPLLPLVVAELHRQDLLNDADHDRRVRLAELAGQRTPLWRRMVGRVARSASGALGAMAGRLDPAERTTLDLAR